MNRNAVKYQPFKPLEGHDEALREKERNLKIEEKPILSYDEEERINNNLVEIINDKLKGRFHIFKKDKIIQIESKINKVLNGYLYLEDDVILISDIVNIEII